MKLLGLDPGLRHTGWGLVGTEGNRLHHIANGCVHIDADQPLAARLAQLYDALAEVIASHNPEEAAVEESFVSRNAVSTLKLGLARGVVLLAPARAGLVVAEYPANRIKKSVVGAGHAGKQQVAAMVRVLLPGCEPEGADAADALAVAICHAHYRQTRRAIAAAGESALGGRP